MITAFACKLKNCGYIIAFHGTFDQGGENNLLQVKVKRLRDHSNVLIFQPNVCYAVNHSTAHYNQTTDAK